MNREALCALFGSLWACLGLSVALLACEQGPTELLPDAAVPSLELGSAGPRMQLVPLVLGSPLSAELSVDAPSYVFSFTLSAPAKVSLHTQAVAGGPVVDTVLGLSRLDQYGLPRVVGTSDDYAHTPFSGLERTLSKGSYRLLVRGATLRNRGPFVLASSCSGAGCPAPPESCLFGEQFSELRTSALLQVESEDWITSEAQLTSALMRDQVVLAVQQSAHKDATSPAQALAAVDQNEIRHMELTELRSRRSFTVYEYGAGDNSYGAIFDQASLTLAASIRDGEFYDCAVSP